MYIILMTGELDLMKSLKEILNRERKNFEFRFYI